MGMQGCADFVRYGLSKEEAPKGWMGPHKENPIHPLLRDHKILLLLVQGPSPLAGEPSKR